MVCLRRMVQISGFAQIVGIGVEAVLLVRTCSGVSAGEYMDISAMKQRISCVENRHARWKSARRAEVENRPSIERFAGPGNRELQMVAKISSRLYIDGW